MSGWGKFARMMPKYFRNIKCRRNGNASFHRRSFHLKPYKAGAQGPAEVLFASVSEAPPGLINSGLAVAAIATISLFEIVLIRKRPDEP